MGKFVFPGIDVDVTSPVVATIGLQLQQPADGTGTVDLVTATIFGPRAFFVASRI